MLTCKFTKKTLSHILLHVFYLHFLIMYQDYFFGRGFESVGAQFLSGNISGKWYNLQLTINYDSSKSTFFVMWIWHLTFSRVQFLSNKSEFFVSSNNINITRTSLFLLCLFICTFFLKKVIALHHGDDNFLIWHLYLSFTLSIIISTMKK